ncbi:MAG: sigma-70 family RNA polymerase sigma factor [Deltaproteobacteria bacterium]|nr:sigma-70 family RNA polymerase sigma factor [Deltaproteobacteria bacterium]
MKPFRSRSLAEHIEKTVREGYERFASYIYSHLIPILKNDADAWDITQETFIRYFKYLSKGKEVEYPLTFLYRTSTRLAIKYLGRAHRKIEPVGDPPELLVESEQLRLEAWSVIKAIWGQLDPKGKIVAKMLVVDEMTPSEICQNSGFSQGSINRRIKKFQALAKKEAHIFHDLKNKAIRSATSGPQLIREGDENHE